MYLLKGDCGLSLKTLNGSLPTCYKDQIVTTKVAKYSKCSLLISPNLHVYEGFGTPLESLNFEDLLTHTTL